MSIWSPKTAPGKSVVTLFYSVVLYIAAVGLLQNWGPATYQTPRFIIHVADLMQMTVALPWVVLIYCILLTFLHASYKKPWLRNLALSPPRIGQMILWVVVAVVGVLLLRYEFYGADPHRIISLFPLFHYHILGTGVLSDTGLLMYLLVMPILIQLLFRGLLFSGLASTFGEGSALVVTSYMAVMAFAPRAPFVLVLHIIVNVLFGLARLNTQSVWTPMVMDVIIRLLLLSMTGVLSQVV